MQVYWVAQRLPDTYLCTEVTYLPSLPLEHWEYESEFTFNKELKLPPPISDRVASSLPKRMRYVSDSGLVPDYIDRLGAAIISDRLRAIFDQLDPNRHTYFDLEVENSTGSISQYYIVNIARLTGALDEEKSKLELYAPPGSGMEKRKVHSLWGGAGIVFKEPSIAGRHFWRSIEAPIFGRRFASEQFKYEVESNGIVGMLFDLCRPI